MRILSIHSRYQIRGGEDESREAEEGLLRDHGHQVAVYEENNERIAQVNQLQMALRTIWSREAYATVRGKLAHGPYDLVHVQNFFPLISPSVYYAARAAGVPVVQTLRNYRLLCPNALFFRQGRVCEDCLGQPIPWPGVMHGCYRGSRPASGVVATMLTVHRGLATWSKMVDVYIALTEFSRQKFIEGGLPAEKIVVKPNFVAANLQPGDGQGGYALFVGRLSPEKGLETLLQAWNGLGTAMPLKIVGEGPLAPRVVEACQRLPQVEWLGRRPLEEVYDLMGAASILVFPSEWYETFGRVAVEGFAKGTPAVAANIGAIAELVEHGKTGLHFRPGDAADLTAKIEWILAHPQELAQMRYQARLAFETRYTPEENYHRLMAIYEQVCRP